MGFWKVSSLYTGVGFEMMEFLQLKNGRSTAKDIFSVKRWDILPLFSIDLINHIGNYKRLKILFDLLVVFEFGF